VTAHRDNDFWRFSLAIYAQDEVAQECLALQDALNVDVNLLLFCAWTGTRGVVLSKADIDAASDTVGAWQEKVVRPLRGVRRELRLLGNDQSFRPKVKEIELDAEQTEQATLFAYWQSIEKGRARTSAHDAIEQNIKEYIGISSGGTRGKVSASYLIAAARRFASV
jgi:uncharacterized protein (TIGR02444 family)